MSESGEGGAWATGPAGGDERPAFGLGLLKVPVLSVETASTWYVDVLGCALVFVVGEYGWAQLQAGDLPLALYQPGLGGGDGTPGGSTGFHLTLDGPAFDALAARLDAAGDLVDGKVHTADDGGTFLEARDPDGNTVKVARVG